MEQNQPAHGAPAAAATDEPAARPHLPGVSRAADADPSSDEPDFATDEAATAYWQGVADGIRQSGGTVPPRLAARAGREQNGLLAAWHGDQAPPPAPPANAGGESGGDSPPRFRGGLSGEQRPALFRPCRGHGRPDNGGGTFCLPSLDPAQNALAFTPALPRPRHDGWTPARQIAFVEALADCGIVRHAAAKVGMTEQGVGNLRRRADAVAFNRACDAALALGGRRLVSIAYERAIEGTIKRHYFHGELKAEERVYDNRLLVALINRLPDRQEQRAVAEDAVANWDGWLGAIAAGRSAPEPPPAPAAPAAPAARPFEGLVFDCGHGLLTNCPPPEDFFDDDGYEHDEPGTDDYQRELTGPELAWWDAEGRAAAEQRQDAGYVEWRLGRATFFPWGSERTESSAAAAEPESEWSEASEPSGERPARPADGPAHAEPDRRHGFAGTAPEDHAA